MSVIYVAGAMRSGTTIMGQLLASSADTVLVGEIRPALAEPERHEECDCGRHRSDCPFWTQVYGSDDPAVVAAATGRPFSLITAVRIARSVLRGRGLPADVRRTVGFLRSVRNAAGDRVIIDTSKSPMGILLWRLAGEDVHVVQCVRNVWQVAKAQARPTSETGLVREPIWRSILLWIAYNGFTVLAGGLASSRRLVSFRRLRREPRRMVEPVWSAAGATPGADLGPTFHYDESHVLAGNPRRARGRSITITA